MENKLENEQLPEENNNLQEVSSTEAQHQTETISEETFGNPENETIITALEEMPEVAVSENVSTEITVEDVKPETFEENVNEGNPIEQPVEMMEVAMEIPETTAEMPAEEVLAETIVVEAIEPPAEIMEVAIEAPQTIAEESTETIHEAAIEMIEAPMEAQAVVAETIAKEEMPIDEPMITAETSVQAIEMLAEINSIQEEILEETEEEILDETKDETTEEDLNTLSREHLVELLENVVKTDDINSVKNKVALIKVAFLKINKEEKSQKYNAFIAEGGNNDDYDKSDDILEDRFHAAFAVYKEKKAIFNDGQEKVKVKNLEAKNLILEQLKVLIDSEETLKKTYDEFTSLQEKWKDIGMVPQGEVTNLWHTYHYLVEKFFDKIKINKELKDLDLKKNLEQKMILCEKTEELLIEPSTLKAFQALQKYHEEWKEIGPVPMDKKDEIWDRFKTATDKINKDRQEFYDQQYAEQENNYLAKVALCEKIESMIGAESTKLNQWQAQNNEANDLIKIWRSLGPAPKKLNNEIWERFRNALETFFSSKKDYFGKIKDEQVNNYNLKLDLCAQAEAVKNSQDWRNTTEQLIRLQGEWKKIGPVPRRYAEIVWKRFRGACDEFFQTKTEFFKHIKQHEDENLKKKLELIQKIDEFQFGNDRSENLNILKDFQREWSEIGHVPMSEKDSLHVKFRTSINVQLDKLKINSVEIKSQEFKHRVEDMKNSPNAKFDIIREKNALALKIQKIKDDINLWENNIGFLASSKKADLLKEEFLNKIQKSKDEVNFLEVKLKYLKNNSN